MNIIPHIFYPLTIGLGIFTVAFFKYPRYAIAGIIIAKPIIDTTWNYYILLEINFLKLYAGLFVILGIIYIIIRKVPIKKSSPLTGEGKGEGVTNTPPPRNSHTPLSKNSHCEGIARSNSICLLWILFIISTFTSVFLITGFHYRIVQLKYVLSVANGFIIFILCKNIFNFEKDKGFFIKTFLLAGVFPILLWLIPIIFGNQIFSNDELLRVQGPYQNFWQFAFAGLQTLIFCLAWLSFRKYDPQPEADPLSAEKSVSSKDSPTRRFSLSPKYIIIIIMMIISLSIIYGSYSKAFWLAGFLVLVVGFILMRKYILVVIVPVIIAVLFIIPPFNKDIRKTFSNEIGYYVNHSVPKQHVLRGRVEVWKQALRQYLKLPFSQRVFGMGITQGRLCDDGIENDYLRVFVEQGFVGLLIYLGLFATIIVALMRRYFAAPNPIALAALLSVVALVILSIGANPLHIPNVQWLVWGSAGFALSKKNEVCRLS